MGKYAPASIILDVTKTGAGIKLGVLNQLVNDDSDTSTIKFGKPGDKLDINKGTFTSTVHVQGAGVIFAGDFPHVGVRNVEKKTKFWLTL